MFYHMQWPQICWWTYHGRKTKYSCKSVTMILFLLPLFLCHAILLFLLLQILLKFHSFFETLSVHFWQWHIQCLWNKFEFAYYMCMPCKFEWKKNTSFLSFLLIFVLCYRDAFQHHWRNPSWNQNKNTDRLYW